VQTQQARVRSPTRSNGKLNILLLLSLLSHSHTHTHIRSLSLSLPLCRLGRHLVASRLHTDINSRPFLLSSRPTTRDVESRRTNAGAGYLVHERERDESAPSSSSARTYYAGRHATADRAHDERARWMRACAQARTRASGRFSRKLSKKDLHDADLPTKSRWSFSGLRPGDDSIEEIHARAMTRWPRITNDRACARMYVRTHARMCNARLAFVVSSCVCGRIRHERNPAAC